MIRCIFPQRTRVFRFSLILFVTLFSQNSFGLDCTDGVDCYCDKQVVKGDAALLVCEDFEDPAFYEDVPGAWYQSPSGDNGYRGGGNRWLSKYSGTGAGNWRLGKPVNPLRGYTCNYSTCGPAEWHPTDLWNGNSEAGIDIQQQGDVALEVPGLTLDSQSHDLGKRWMAWRIPVGSTQGKLGEPRFNPATTELGITYLGGYSTNLLSATGSTNGDFVPHPWKHEEWGSTDSPVFQGNFGGGGAPFAPSIASPLGLSVSSCQSILATATVSTGQLVCGDLSQNGSQAYLRVSSNFDRSNEWPLGTLACIRGHIKGLGSATGGSLKLWFNEKLIFSIENANFQALIRDQNLPGMVWNTYYNGNAAPPVGAPPFPTQTFYRYQDNIHMRRGAPVSCAQVGFLGSSGDVTPPAPPANLTVQ